MLLSFTNICRTLLVSLLIITGVCSSPELITAASTTPQTQLSLLVDEPTVVSIEQYEDNIQGVNWVTSQEYLNLLTENLQPFILYIGSWMCKYCRAASTELSMFISKASIPVYYLDTVDSFEDTSSANIDDILETLAPYKLQGTPTFYAFSKATPIAEFIGATVTLSDLVNLENKALAY
ncbi:hypothetical protein [Lacticaseibacillus jixiensis]|uniref:hypothetical protein n=1 Tax=Lacticaseibacillus jixiensis TaxID=3231926 RepID=UPI0036F2263E